MTQTETSQGLRCLVVDDEDDIAELVILAMSQNGFEVKRASSGEMAIDLCKEEVPDVVILDLDLPGINGHETASQLREFTDTYILMLSGYGNTDDRLSALTSSADDYVSKPFSRDELVARVQALLRRPRNIGAKSARLKVNPAARSVSVANNDLFLTVLEFDLIARLADSMSEMVSKPDLIECGWGTPTGATPHILNVHIHNLRRKLSAVDEQMVIESIRGQGFRLLDRRSEI